MSILPPMLILTGHPRSGTELLFELCRAHPDIALTLESGLFRCLGVPASLFQLSTLGRAIARRQATIFPLEDTKPTFRQQIRSHRFMAGIARDVAARQKGLLTAADGGAALHRAWPRARIVGEKFPDHVFNLGPLVDAPGMKTIVIERDGRDVVASYLQRLAGGWANLPAFGAWSDAESIARRWVEAVKATERQAGRVLLIRYERLVAEPISELARIAAYLEIDPAGFAATAGRIRSTSVGGHMRRLTDAQREAVMRIAGPVLERRGYL